MKAIAVILILLGIGLAVMYSQGGYQSFDPVQAGKDARAAIQPGMTWDQVVDLAKATPKFCYILEHMEVINGQQIPVLKQSSASQFNRKKVERKLANNELPNGFVLQYKFTETVAFEVACDGTGTVTEIRNMMTVADLLGTKE